MELILYLFVALFIAVIIITFVPFIFAFYRALRAPSIAYAQMPSMNELIKELSCPKCGSKQLENLGHGVIRCRECGFIFSVWPYRGYAVPYLWWVWPFLWWPPVWVWLYAWPPRRLNNP